MSTSLLRFQVSINRLWPGEKLAIGDRRWARFNGAFKKETHTCESLLAEIRKGHSFCCILGGCDLDHCGVRWCCPHRKNDPDHCGRPVGYRNASHFVSAQTLELDFDQGNEMSSIPYLLTDPFIAEYASFMYSTLGSSPQTPKTRVVFVLESPITDPGLYHRGRKALLAAYPKSDQSIKDVARFLYGSHPDAGEFQYV